MNQLFRNSSIVLLIVGLTIVQFSFFGCAQIVAPTGGVRDTIPPTVLNSVPPNGQLNFQSNRIEIEFDEFIKLKNIKEQLIVSPPLKYDLDAKIIGKQLRLEIEDTLKANTTYVLNFGNAIVDNREGNPISNFQYVFSTGEQIDSLSAGGLVIDAFSLELEENILVMLYKELENDSIPMLELPDYVARTDKAGSFLITNIQEGDYKVFALKDGNNNYLFDRPDEKIAFTEEILSINKPIDSIYLYSFQEDRQKQFIEKQKEQDVKLILDFKKEISSLNYSLIDTSSSILLKSYLSNTRDSAIFWWKEMPKNRIRMAISDDTLFSDTIKVKIDSLNANSKLKMGPITSRQNFFRPINLNFNRPILKIDSSKILLHARDSLPIKYQLRPDTLNPLNYHLNFSFKEDSSYWVQLLPGAFVDLYGRTHDTLSSRFTFNKASDFGNLALNIKSNETSMMLVQLTNTRGDVVQEKIAERGAVAFEYLIEGKYKLKLILDRNANGKWDTGEYMDYKQAETIILFDETINIRANWDKEIEWIIQ